MEEVLDLAGQVAQLAGLAENLWQVLVLGFEGPGVHQQSLFVGVLGRAPNSGMIMVAAQHSGEGFFGSTAPWNRGLTRRGS
ncbi:hypothetical protein DYH09_10110 [bacterium CPR1]|nr:hypothetical protein [bacterium CPR1]